MKKERRERIIIHDLDRCVANLELALPHYRKTVRIYRAINRGDDADSAAKIVVIVEELLRQFAAETASATRR